MARVKTADLQPGSKSIRSFIENSTMTKTLLKVLGVFGVSLVMSGTLLELVDHLSFFAEVRCRRRSDPGSVGSGRYTRVEFSISDLLNKATTDTNQP